MKKISLACAIVVGVLSSGSAAIATYKSSDKFVGTNKASIWKAAMEVMKDYNLDVINREEGFISTYRMDRDWPPGKYIIFIKIYDNYFEVKADVITGNKMFRGSYEKLEKEIIEMITAKINSNREREEDNQ